VAVLAACSGGGAAASVTPPPDAVVTITAKDNQFDQAAVDVPAAADFGLFFKNLDGVPHNVAVFTDSSAAKSIFVGQTITDAATTYDVPALEPGTYFFRCDVHPDMTGSLVAAS
jgi:plastocyanin